jgi:hypothetical protein
MPERRAALPRLAAGTVRALAAAVPRAPRRRATATAETADLLQRRQQRRPRRVPPPERCSAPRYARRGLYSCPTVIDLIITYV